MRSSLHALGGLFATLAAAILLNTPATAEPKKATPPTSAQTKSAQSKSAQAKAPAGEAVRYFTFTGELLGDLPLDGFLKEVRQGGRVVSAVLDVCHWTSKADPTRDRFVIPLKVDGTKLTGQGQSQEKKTPVTIELSRRQTGQTISFNGAITRGGDQVIVQSSDNNDMSEADFLDDTESSEDPIEAAPRDFHDVSPGSVGVKIRRESLPSLLKALKGLDAEIMFESLGQTCASLRSGRQIVHLDVDPDRADALIDKLRAWPEAIAVGWTSGYAIDRAIRIASAGLRNGTTFDRDKVSAALGAAVATYFDATFDGATWDPVTAELTLRLKRPSRILPGLGLTDIIEVMMLVGPARLSSNEWLVVRVGNMNLSTVDDGPEPRLRIAKTGTEDAEAARDDDEASDAMIRALADALKGNVWSTAARRWQ